MSAKRAGVVAGFATIASGKTPVVARSVCALALDRRAAMVSRRSCAASIIRSIGAARSEEHTSELQSLMRISYAVFCLKKKRSHRRIEPNYYRKQTHSRYDNQ